MLHVLPKVNPVAPRGVLAEMAFVEQVLGEGLHNGEHLVHGILVLTVLSVVLDPSMGPRRGFRGLGLVSAGGAVWGSCGSLETWARWVSTTDAARGIQITSECQISHGRPSTSSCPAGQRNIQTCPRSSSAQQSFF